MVKAIPPLIKQLTEAALDAEIENYLEENPKPTHCRTGYVASKDQKALMTDLKSLFTGRTQ